MHQSKFHLVSHDQIKQGMCTDVYFLRTEQILRSKNLNPLVVAEVSSDSQTWGILAGVNQVIDLLEGIPVDVYSMPEGCLFFRGEPVLRIEGHYLDFARYETEILGFLCHSSGIATKAFRLKLAAGDKLVISFGTRRQHPMLAKLIEYCAYLGGCDGVSNFLGAQDLGIEPMGTMPHSLIICFGDQAKAFKAFDEVMPPQVPRICLCDTWYDEKQEALIAAEALGERLDMVRLDTPSSRRGDFRRIVEEVRWELDLRGYTKVGILLSGGIDEEQIIKLRDVVEGFGVGTCLANARVVDFALDLVEVEGKPCSKRGKRAGKKQVLRNWETMEDKVVPHGQEIPGMQPLLEKLLEKGRIVKRYDLQESRKRVLDQLRKIRELKLKLD